MNSGLVFGSYPSSSIRTGSRCTTLTKILGREQRQRRSRALRKPGDPTLEYVSASIHVDIEIDRLADAQITQLRFFEIGIDPDLAERSDRHQILSNLHIIARIDISARHNPVNLCNDIAVTKIEFSLNEIALGGFEFRFRLRRAPLLWPPEGPPSLCRQPLSSQRLRPQKAPCPTGREDLLCEYGCCHQPARG